MSFFNSPLINKIKWSLRRVTLKVPSEALVLEVGSGGNPYPRSNVLLDAYEETRERHWDALVHDRPTVLSFGENLPFKDKAFDYVISAHVLEHSASPDKFLAELQRVASGGYIESPDAFMERINPYKDHRLEVTVRDEILIVRKKHAWVCDEELVELYENQAKGVIARKTIPQNAAVFHVRYFWKDKIKYRIVNPEADATWAPPSSVLNSFPQKLSIKSKLRALILNFIRICFSQRHRNAKLDILPLMRCSKCHSEHLERSSEREFMCKGCNSTYKIDRNVFRMH